jgi:hypothetical protein
MRSLTRTLLIPLTLCAGAAFDAAAGAQTRGTAVGRGAVAPVVIAPGPVSAVRDAPYSAEAITTVTQMLGDGTKIERSVRASVFRDGMGRTRREQTVLGLASLAPSADALRVITITDPVARVTITLDEQTRTARQTPLLEMRFFERATGAQQIQAFRLGRQGGAGLDAAAMTRLSELLDQLAARRGGFDDRDRQLADLAAQLVQQPAGGGNTGVVANLGTRQMEQLTVTGRRTTQTIPAGAVGNDRPIEIVDETWESPDLQVVVSSRHADPRTGTIEYRLANVRRGEPPADLFVVPADYTMIASTLATTYAGALTVSRPGTPSPAPVAPAAPIAPPGRSGLPLPPGVPSPAPGARGRGAITPFGVSTSSTAPSIFVIGEGGKPGSYPFEPGMTLQQALDRASTAMPRNGRVALIRNGREWATAAEASTALQPGDVLMVLSKK